MRLSRSNINRHVSLVLSQRELNKGVHPMYFKQLLDERYGCASYVVASRQSHEAVIVDPSLDVEQYEALLHERDFQLRYVIDTHVHADHLSGARQLAAKYGVKVCLYESAQVAYPYHPLRDGEGLALGQV